MINKVAHSLGIKSNLGFNIIYNNGSYNMNVTKYY